MAAASTTTSPAAPTPTPAPESALLTAEDKLLLSSTTTHEKLLVSQAVFEKGTKDWKGVAGLIRGHKLIGRERGKEWFEGKRLARLWAAQMHETGHEEKLHFTSQGPELRKIAHYYYMARVHELYAGMEACQDQFRIIFSEIEELKQGKLDWKLTHPDRTVPPGITNSPPKAAATTLLPAQLPPLAELPRLPVILPMPELGGAAARVATEAEAAAEGGDEAALPEEEEAPKAEEQDADVEMQSVETETDGAAEPEPEAEEAAAA
ncbi:hypothetical protein JCM10908_004841 [Rhodotorula pacifica]|uniref:uncharacterized protein n=1 Tax=Rhodotorula pacifica TaxID=1495444 RepID=UPI00317F316C